MIDYKATIELMGKLAKEYMHKAIQWEEEYTKIKAILATGTIEGVALTTAQKTAYKSKLAAMEAMLDKTCKDLAVAPVEVVEVKTVV